MKYVPYNSEIANLPDYKGYKRDGLSMAEYLKSIGGIRMQSFSDYIVAYTFDYFQIIADATYEMLNDETFADEVCAEHRSIAQAILDAIKAVLKKLRIMLADGESFTPKQNADLLSQLDILKECEKIWTDGLARASENRYAVMRSDVDTVKYSKKNDNSSIREQLRENLNKLADMKPVADVKYESIKHLNRSEKAKIIMSEYSKKFKGGIERRGFGFIVLREDEVTGSLKYLHTDGEFAAFKALPQVLKRGKIIEDHTNHKGRAVNTITIAAPVTINGTTGYMAAAVKSGGKSRYHVHRILMPDGSEFEFNKKTEPIGAGVPIKNDSKGSAVSSVSENSLTSADGKRNKKLSLTDSDGRELSEQQAEYFKDSKVRDEDGNLLVMYHGTPKGDFTVFKDGSYFTQNRRYADGYQNETTGRTELNPKTYEVYLNYSRKKMTT